MKSRITLLAALAALAAGGVLAGNAAARHPKHGVEGAAFAKDADRDRERGEVLKPSGLDVYWLKSSVQGDLFEIAGGKLALTKTTDPAVKTLAQTLITDHTQSLNDARQLAARFGIKLDESPTPSQQWELQQVSTLSGTAFDQAWSKLEVLDHQQDISDTSDEVQMGSDQLVRGDAQKEIPMLQKHLSLAEQALKASGGS